MKKLCLALAVLILISSAALADVDLSAYSFDELAALRDQIQLEMMKRDQWQEVTVPQGTWAVGVNIPAGVWMVRCRDVGRDDYLLSRCLIRWGKNKPDDGFFEYLDEKGDVEIYNPASTYYNGQTTEYILELDAGDYVYIDPQYNRAVFSPYTGAPGFSFK